MKESRFILYAYLKAVSSFAVNWQKDLRCCLFRIKPDRYHQRQFSLNFQSLVGRQRFGCSTVRHFSRRRLFRHSFCCIGRCCLILGIRHQLRHLCNGRRRLLFGFVQRRQIRHDLFQIRHIRLPLRLRLQLGQLQEKSGDQISGLFRRLDTDQLHTLLFRRYRQNLL